MPQGAAASSMWLIAKIVSHWAAVIGGVSLGAHVTCECHKIGFDDRLGDQSGGADGLLLRLRVGDRHQRKRESKQ